MRDSEETIPRDDNRIVRINAKISDIIEQVEMIHMLSSKLTKQLEIISAELESIYIES